jgi:hypothetical protein
MNGFYTFQGMLCGRRRGGGDALMARPNAVSSGATELITDGPKIAAFKVVQLV